MYGSALTRFWVGTVKLVRRGERVARLRRGSAARRAGRLQTCVMAGCAVSLGEGTRGYVVVCAVEAGIALGARLDWPVPCPYVTSSPAPS
jgi:hypothetical protein